MTENKTRLLRVDDDFIAAMSGLGFHIELGKPLEYVTPRVWGRMDEQVFYPTFVKDQRRIASPLCAICGSPMEGEPLDSPDMYERDEDVPVGWSCACRDAKPDKPSTKPVEGQLTVDEALQGATGEQT